MSGQSTENKRSSDLKTLAIRGVMFNYLGRGCSIVITFFLTPFLVSTLGDERYGLWSIVMSLTGYYALADLGMRASGTKHIAAAHAGNDHKKVNEIIVTALGMYAATAFVVLVVVGFVAWWFPALIDVPGEKREVLQLIVFLTGLNFAVGLVGQPFGSVLSALARFDISNIIGVVSQVLAAACMVLALSLHTGLLGMAIATLCVGVFTQLFHLVCVRRLLPVLSFSRRHFSLSRCKELFSFSVGVFTINGLRRITDYTSPIIIGVIVGPASVAIYSIAEALIRKGSGLTKGLSTVVMPLASRLDAADNRAALLRMSILVNRLMQAASLFLLVVFAVMGERLIELWIGPGYGERVYPVLCLLAVANVATMISAGIPSTLIGINQLHALRVIAVIEALLSLTLGVTLTYIDGIRGMAVSLLIVRVVTYSVLLPMIAALQLKLPRTKLILESKLPPCIAITPAALLCYVLERYLPAGSVWILLIEVGCVGLVAVFSTLLFCVPSSERGILLRQVKRSRHRDRSLADTQTQSLPT